MKIETKHTPGPWKWYALPGGDNLSLEPIREKSEGGQVLEIRASEISEEDAALIAAAPELLEAAKKWIAWYERGWMPQSQMSREDEAFVRAAIAKAEGR